MAAMHAHVDYLQKRADFVFLPVYLSDGDENGANNQYCYYTQFVSSVITVQKRFQPREKFYSLDKVFAGPTFCNNGTHRMLRTTGIRDKGILQVTKAYNNAKQIYPGQRN